MHFRILCNSTKDHRPTLSEFESNSPLFYPTTTIDPPIKMVSYTGFLISSNAEIHLQNEVTSRYIYIQSHFTIPVTDFFTQSVPLLFLPSSNFLPSSLVSHLYSGPFMSNTALLCSRLRAITSQLGMCLLF